MLREHALCRSYGGSAARDDGFLWPDASEIFFVCHVLDCHKRKPRWLSWGTSDRDPKVGTSALPSYGALVGAVPDFQRAHCLCNLSGSGVSFVMVDFTVRVFP